MKANATYFIRIFFMAIAGTVFALQADAAPDVLEPGGREQMGAGAED